MARTQRVSDVVELISETTIVSGIGGLISLGIGTYLFSYRGNSGATVPIAIVLWVIGGALVAYSARSAYRFRGVSRVGIRCPYCNKGNDVTSVPDGDFTCQHCNRLIPINDGQPLSVAQVRCGYCNALNYYSAKTEVLLCESCDREIPIAIEEGRAKKTLAAAYKVTDDDAMYELVLVDRGPKHEEVVDVLQHMLALNRNQVKGILDNLPQTLLQGIPRRKADMLIAQLSVHGAQAEARAIPQ